MALPLTCPHTLCLHTVCLHIFSSRILCLRIILPRTLCPPTLCPRTLCPVPSSPVSSVPVPLNLYPPFPSHNPNAHLRTQSWQLLRVKQGELQRSFVFTELGLQCGRQAIRPVQPTQTLRMDSARRLSGAVAHEGPEVCVGHGAWGMGKVIELLVKGWPLPVESTPLRHFERTSIVSFASPNKPDSRVDSASKSPSF